jgi:hypothetical protein
VLISGEELMKVSSTAERKTDPVRRFLTFKAEIQQVRKEIRTMKINKAFFLMGFVISSVLFFEVAAHADEWDLRTKLTFNRPIQIPGKVLSAGTYLFKLADTNDRHIVQVFNSDGTVLYATVMTFGTERRNPSGDSVVTLAEQGPGRPDALLEWFYPGSTSGNAFIYPKQEAQQLAQDRQQTILARHTAEAGD